MRSLRSPVPTWSWRAVAVSLRCFSWAASRIRERKTRMHFHHFMQHVQLERTERKTNGVVGFLSKLCFKKKSRADIVKLVASGDLVPAQLVQIKSGIEKGLTESQLVELINNNLAAEKMKEIIEIAILENSMAY